jgi:hypothetical protein
MTRTRRRIALTVATAAGLAVLGLAAPQADAQVAAPAAEALCVDLSALNLPSVCVGSLLG